VLLIHNRYLERGGEEAVFEGEARLLEARGHRVVRWEVDNARVAELGALRLGARTVWSVEAHRAALRLAREVRPDVAHVHNTLPLLSPSVHHALSSEGTAVVQTLHNFRLLCPQGMHLREGRPCDACVGRAPVAAVRHACYRGSRAATAAVAAMLTVHRGLGTWTRHVDAFVALSAFARDRFLKGGLPAERLHVKANFVDPDPGEGRGDGDFLLFVGRLADEKGVSTLLHAWGVVTARRARRDRSGGASPPGRLVLVGDGPRAPWVRDRMRALPGLEWEGRRSRERVLELMGRARALVFPSLCYENSPAVLAEAFARGLPVIASRLGSTAELVREGVSGRLFAAADPHDLARALEWALSTDELPPLRVGARAAFEASHTADAGAARLLEIYAAAMAHRRARGGKRGGAPAGTRS
jgi:glycosyltransferase involved in cell wall biosynthesis